MLNPDDYVFEDEMTEFYQYFMEKYQPEILEVTDENRAIVKGIDPKLVWTYHSTCGEEMLSPGFLEFSPTSCCWQEQAWYVCKTPWESDDSKHWIPMSATLPCTECNEDLMRDEDEGAEDCPTCDGNAMYRFYID